MIRSLMHRITKWYEQKLGIGVYGLKGSEIIKYRGIRKPITIPVDEIESWTVYPEMVFDIVIVNLKNGYYWQLLDKYNDLIGILKLVEKDRELEPND